MKKLSIIKFLFFLALSPTTFLYAQSHKEKIIQKKRELRLAEKTYKDAEKKFNSLRDELYQLRLKNGYWTRQGFLGINFSRAEFNNWAAGGANSYAVNSTLTCKADYKKNKFTWENFVDLSIGFTKNADENSKKSEDKIDILSKFSFETKKRAKFRFAALLNFKSQFAQGFDFSNEGKPILNSRFFAPAYILSSLGFEYKPTQPLSLLFSPASGKFTIVQNKALAEKHFFIPSSAANPNFRSELGASLNVLIQKRIRKSINLRSRLELFNNYLDPNRANRKNIDISWETSLNFKISKYIGVSFLTYLLYDDDINITFKVNEQGVEIEKLGPKIQFKDVLGIGFSYQF